MARFLRCIETPRPSRASGSEHSEVLATTVLEGPRGFDTAQKARHSTAADWVVRSVTRMGYRFHGGTPGRRLSNSATSLAWHSAEYRPS